MFIISCGKDKLDVAAPARELYTGRVFVDTVRAIESTGRPFRIVSAKYGLLDPDDVVEPYEFKLPDTREGSAYLAQKLLAQDLPDAALLLVPRQYERAIKWAGIRYINWFGNLRNNGLFDQRHMVAELRAGRIDVAKYEKRLGIV